MCIKEVYRADDRAPAEIQKQGGFTTRIPEFDINCVRQIISIYAGVKVISDCRDVAALAKQKKLNLQARVVEEESVTPGDLMRWIVSEKDRERPTVSTSISTDCGGFASKGMYRYTIGCSELKPVSWSAAVPGASVVDNVSCPLLYLDADTLGEASVVAVLSKQGGDSRELTFFTPIAADAITKVESL